jgi:hypothetical protein
LRACASAWLYEARRHRGLDVGAGVWRMGGCARQACPREVQILFWISNYYNSSLLIYPPTGI